MLNYFDNLNKIPLRQNFSNYVNLIIHNNFFCRTELFLIVKTNLFMK
jgi:hypothetical protein